MSTSDELLRLSDECRGRLRAAHASDLRRQLQELSLGYRRLAEQAARLERGPQRVSSGS